MGRPFAMWIERGSALRLRGSLTALAGAVVGRAPEPGDKLQVVAPLCGRAIITCASVVGTPRGAEHAPMALGVEQIEHPARMVGAVLAEDGCRVAAFCAVLRASVPRFVDAARFEFGRDRAWGLVQVTGRVVNVAVVGAGLPGDSFWRVLTKIQPQTRDAIFAADLDPIEHADDPLTAWSVPTIVSRARGEEEVDVAVRSPGPVALTRATVFLDGDWRQARVYQQPEGLITQLRLLRGPLMDTSSVVFPFQAVA